MTLETNPNPLFIVRQTWGSDEFFVACARMSTDGAFRGWPEDEGLLRYLLRNSHTSPFEHGGIAVEAVVPLFVLAQLVRHRTLSFNVHSARYSEMPAEYWVPTPERCLGSTSPGMQGAGREAPDEYRIRKWCSEYVDLMDRIHTCYQEGLDAGIPREVARACTPQSAFTRVTISGCTWNWLRFLNLRLDPHAQLETRCFAEKVEAALREAFPRTLAIARPAPKEAP